MARQQSDFPSNGRQGELQVQRAADMPARDGELREIPLRDTTVRDTTVRERSLGELFRDLTTETSALVTKEIEARQTGATLARDGAKMGIASALAFAGALALTAFLVAGLGDLLGGKYWLSALIIGVLFFGIGMGLVKSATSDMKRRGQSVKHTVDTVKDTGAWAKEEARQVKQEITS
jgi:hypothetical protein